MKPPSLAQTISQRSLPRGFPTPDGQEGDPSQWSPLQLSSFGLPPRPEIMQTRLNEAWNARFGQRLRFLPYRPAFSEVIGRIDLPEPALVSQTSRFVSSPNWSGATLNATSGRRFTQVYGDWVVMNVAQPSGSPDRLFQCACWIGLDGQRHYLNATLPQVGTQESLTVDASRATETILQAWTQWWVPHDTNAKPVFIQDFPLAPGNRISAVLTVTSPHEVLCNLINQSTDPPTIVCVDMPAPHILNPDPSGPLLDEQYTVTGATAEWVLERPAVIGEPDQLETLCDYGTTTFSSCLAVESRDDGSDTVTQTLRTARYIRMFEIRDNPRRTAYISMPQRSGDDSFRLKFGDVWY